MEVKDIKLYEMVYDPVPKHIKHISRNLNMPTEFVVTAPQHVVPQQARIFSTSLWYHDDTIMGYDTLRQEEGFRGTSYYDEIFCVEVWIENGDDGHVAHSMKGWMYVTQSRLEQELKTLNEWETLPLCMRWGPDYAKYYDLYHSKEGANVN